MGQCLLNSDTLLRVERLKMGKNKQVTLSNRMNIGQKTGHTSVCVKKSTARGLAVGNNVENGLRFRKGSARM